jgi:uncharacterized lipoprotein YmbA
MRGRVWLIGVLSLSGCVSLHADRFYSLQAEPAGAEEARSHFSMLARLTVTLPAGLDRNEMILQNGGTVTVLEHERWAAPLAEQMTSVLGQDIERRRADVLVSHLRPAAPGARSLDIALDVVAVRLEKSGRARLDVRWRLEQRATGEIAVGRDSIERTRAGGGYDAVAGALDDCLAALADRLVALLPAAG